MKKFLWPTICVVVILLIGITLSTIKQDKTQSPPAREELIKEEAIIPEPGKDLKIRITEAISALKEDNETLLKNTPTTPEEFIAAANTYLDYDPVINEARDSTNKDITKLVSQLKNNIIASQKKVLPKLRKEYNDFMHNLFWQLDVDVKLAGGNNTELTFTGYQYIANMKKQETMDAISKIVTALRFKKVNFRSSKYDDEAVYYKIDAPKDDVIE